MIRVLALLLVLGALVAVWWLGAPGRVADVTAPPASAEPPTAASAASGQQRIQITEAELNQVLTQQLVGQPLGATPLGPATLTRISTHLSDGHLQADGDARTGAASVPLSLSASGTARNGRAVVVVDEMRAAGVPLPSSAVDSVQQAIQQQIDRQVDQFRLRVSSVSIADGKLTLVGSPRYARPAAEHLARGDKLARYATRSTSKSGPRHAGRTGHAAGRHRFGA